MTFWIVFALTEYAIGFLVALGILRPIVNRGECSLAKAVFVSSFWFPINLVGVLMYAVIRVNRWRISCPAIPSKSG
jgi:hypothetical protein